jgi:hypothetical protein
MTIAGLRSALIPLALALSAAAVLSRPAAIPPIILDGIFVSNPATGDTAVTGVPLLIKWIASGDTVGKYGFGVDLYKGGTKVKRIANAAAGDRQVQWIPDAALSAGTDYTVQVWDFASNGLWYGETTPFALRFVYPKIEVTAPAYQDTLRTGQAFKIRWSSEGFTPGGARIFLLNDGHSTVSNPVEIVGVAVTSAHAFDWVPAAELSEGTYYVYVQDTTAEAGGASLKFNLRAGTVAVSPARRVPGPSAPLPPSASGVLFRGPGNTPVTADGRTGAARSRPASLNP